MEVAEAVKKECLRRGMSPRTAKTYNECIKLFLNYCQKDIKRITKADIKAFLNNLVDKGKTGNTINVYLNSLKFYFENLLGRKMRLDIKYSKKPKRLPIVLTQEETKRLIEATSNPKHKLMIELMYSAGLRVSELIRLKIKDFEFEKNYGWVREGKGRKDRIFILAEKLNARLKEFIQQNNLNYNNYLFKGNKNSHISKETIGAVIKESGKKAGIRKNISCHTLRHSFATHLIENGCSINEVQSLLGHKSTETTMVYIHMANPKILNIKSPLDSLA